MGLHYQPPVSLDRERASLFERPFSLLLLSWTTGLGQLVLQSWLRHHCLQASSMPANNNVRQATLRAEQSSMAPREGEDCAALTAIMFQELSVCIRGFHAQAALRRRAEIQAAARTEPVRAAAVVLELPAVRTPL